jgi:hypothetical protein
VIKIKKDNADNSMLFAANLHDAIVWNPSHSLWRSQREKRTDSEMDYSSVVDLAVGSFYVIPIILERRKEPFVPI